MKPDYGLCGLCKKGKFQFKDKKVVAGTQYNMLECDKCNHEIAKRAE